MAQKERRMAVKFRLLGEDEELKIKWPVTIRSPKDGGFEEQSLTAEFLILPGKEFDETLKSVPDHGMEAVLRRVWTGWEGVEGDVPFSPQARDRAISYLHICIGVFDAYRDCLLGAAPKN
jgi:hypothetical protein